MLRACLDVLEQIEEADDELRRELQVGLDELERGETYSAEEVLEMMRKYRETDPDRQKVSSPHHLSLTPEMKRFVEEQVRSGHYASASAMMEAGLRLLQMEEEERRCEIQVGLDQIERGQVADGDEALTRLGSRIGRDRVRDPGLQQFVEQKVRSGEYDSAGEVLEAGLQLLQEEDFADEELDRELRIGLDASARGEVLPAEQAHELMMRWREEDLL